MKIIPRFLLLILLYAALSTQHAALSANEDVNTRAEEWEQLRLQKLQHIEPYSQNKIEKYLLQIEEGFLQGKPVVNYKGLSPQFGTITTGSSIALGVLYWKPNIGGSILDLQASGGYSLLGYQDYAFQLGRISQQPTLFFQPPDFAGNTLQFGDITTQREKDFFLYADLHYRNFPQQDFFGIGPDSSDDNRTDYKFEATTYEAVVGYQFNQWLRTGIRTGFGQIHIARGTDDSLTDTQDLFDDVSAPGLDEQPDFFRLSSSVIFNYRDKPANPHLGGMLGFTFSRYEDLDRDQFSFNRFAFDARHYLPLGSPARVLALWFFTSLDDPDEGSQVPFYLQETLGGSDVLQGFRAFRFRDTNLLYLAAEYRWEASDYLEFALIYGTGKVFADRSDFNLDDLEDSYGFGVRFKTPNTVIFRVDIGYSDEGTRFYLKFGSSF